MTGFRQQSVSEGILNGSRVPAQTRSDSVYGFQALARHNALREKW